MKIDSHNQQDVRRYGYMVAMWSRDWLPKAFEIIRQMDEGTLPSEMAFVALEKLDENRLGRSLLQLTRMNSARKAKARKKTMNGEPKIQPGVQTARGAAQSLTEAGKFIEAAEAYERLAKLFPEDATLWRDLGLCYSVLDQHEQAVTAFNRAVTLRPDFANAWDMLGMQFWDAEQFALAAVAFEKAIAVDPNNKHSLATLAQMYALLHRADDAWDAWCRLRDSDAEYAKTIEFMVREFLEF